MTISGSPNALVPGFLLVALACPSRAQFASSGTTTLSVTMRAGAIAQINTSTTTLTSAGATFNQNYTGTTSFTFKIRTTKAAGTGSVSLKVTTDFSPSGGPSRPTSPTENDALAYTCSLTGLGTACSGSQTASATEPYSGGTFGANTTSASARQ